MGSYEKEASKKKRKKERKGGIQAMNGWKAGQSRNGTLSYWSIIELFSMLN